MWLRIYTFIVHCLTMMIKIVVGRFDRRQITDDSKEGDGEEKDDDDTKTAVMIEKKRRECSTKWTQTDGGNELKKPSSSYSHSFSSSSPSLQPSFSSSLLLLFDCNCLLTPHLSPNTESEEVEKEDQTDRSNKIRRRNIRKQPKQMEHLDEEQRNVMKHFDEVIDEIDELQSASKSTTETPVFVPPPPPVYDIEMTPQPVPRLSHLEKRSPDDEFGFNLHAERNRGHFIGTVDAGGIGEKAGLRMGQRIVGVNGLLVYPNTPHKEVVALIKRSPLSTTLLVASEDVDKWYRDNGVEYSFEKVEKYGEEEEEHGHHHHHHHHHEDHNHSKTNGYEVTAEVPAHNAHSIQVNEERELTTKTTTTTKTEVVDSYQYKADNAPAAYNAYNETSDDLLAAVFQNVALPETKVRTIGEVSVLSHTKELSDVSSISSSVSSHRESAVDVPVDHKYVPSYVPPNQHHNHHHHEHSNDSHHHRHVGTQQHQQPSPLSNGSSHGYTGGSTSGYDDDDIYHLSAKEARERLRMKNRKHHLHDMSLNEKYQLVSNM